MLERSYQFSSYLTAKIVVPMLTSLAFVVSRFPIQYCTKKTKVIKLREFSRCDFILWFVQPKEENTMNHLSFVEEWWFVGGSN